MPFTDEEIFENFQEEVAEKEGMLKHWAKDSDYPHKEYDYSSDDLNDYEYQQDLYSK